jgi:hypothetical protein
VTFIYCGAKNHNGPWVPAPGCHMRELDLRHTGEAE